MSARRNSSVISDYLSGCAKRKQRKILKLNQGNWQRSPVSLSIRLNGNFFSELLSATESDRRKQRSQLPDSWRNQLTIRSWPK